MYKKNVTTFSTRDYIYSSLSWKCQKKNSIAILPSIGVGIPARHICTVRTIDSFDTGESQRSKCPRVKDRPWESPPCCVSGESRAMQANACNKVEAVFYGPLPFFSWIETAPSRTPVPFAPRDAHFDRRLLISALPSLVRLRRNWTNQLRQKLINPIHFEMSSVLPEPFSSLQYKINNLFVKEKIWPVGLKCLFSWIFVSYS